ncbi:MAG: hypothetical protein AXW17_13135, partial [Colwellia sp. Phe_37]
MKQSRGRILFVDDKLMLKSIGYELYSSTDNGVNWCLFVSISVGFFGKIISLIPLAMRIMRKGAYKVIKYESDFVIFADKSIYLYKNTLQLLTRIGFIEDGSRPLYPCIHKDNLYYGEYKSNKERKPTLMHKFSFKKKQWSVCYKFKNIRHVHGVFSDPYTHRLWVTTGDLNHESNIYYSDDDFKTVNLFVGGSQRCRAIYLHFTESSIIYGTDAPDNKNFIFEVSRSEKTIIKKTFVGGPVFFGGVAGHRLLLSTAVEPTKVNETKHMELWVSEQGQWKKGLIVKKDCLPKKLFQYGQIVFPDGGGSTDYIFF